MRSSSGLITIVWWPYKLESVTFWCIVRFNAVGSRLTLLCVIHHEVSGLNNSVVWHGIVKFNCLTRFSNFVWFAYCWRQHAPNLLLEQVASEMCFKLATLVKVGQKLDFGMCSKYSYAVCCWLEAAIDVICQYGCPCKCANSKSYHSPVMLATHFVMVNKQP